MNAAWIVFAVCIVLILGAAIPLLKDLGKQKPPPPPPRKTLKDWRNEK